MSNRRNSLEHVLNPKLYSNVQISGSSNEHYSYRGKRKASKGRKPLVTHRPLYHYCISVPQGHTSKHKERGYEQIQTQKRRIWLGSLQGEENFNHQITVEAI